jgi:hypothetical protein
MGAPLALLASMATGLIPKIAPIAARAGSGLLTRSMAAARPVVSQTAEAVRSEGFESMAQRAGRAAKRYLAPGSRDEYGVRPVETGRYSPASQRDYGIRPVEGPGREPRTFSQPARSQPASVSNQAEGKSDRGTFQRLASLVQQSLRSQSRGISTAANGAPASPLSDVQRAERRASYKEQYGDIIGSGMADDADAADAQRARQEQNEQVIEGAKNIARLGGAAGTLAAGMITAGQTVHKFSTLQLEANRNLAEFSAGISRSYAELDVGQRRRDFDLARRTETTNRWMTTAHGELLEELQGIRVLLENAKNVASASYAKMAIPMAKGWLEMQALNSNTLAMYIAIKSGLVILEQIAKVMPKGDGTTVWNEALRDIANGKFNTVKWGAMPNGQVGQNRRQRQDVPRNDD